MNLKRITTLILTGGLLLAVMAVLPTAFAQDDTATEEPAAVVTEEPDPVVTEEPVATEETAATEEPTATEEPATGEADPTEDPAEDVNVDVDPPTIIASGDEYTIRPGDTLFSIARAYDVSVDDLAALNNIVNPSLIFWGTTLDIPGDDFGEGGPSTETPTPSPSPSPEPPAATTTYVVTEGDNLYRISLRFNTSIARLQALNSIDDADVIFIGQQLVVPAN